MARKIKFLLVMFLLFAFPVFAAVQIQFRRDTAANWTSTNPTLAQGELGYETDTNQFKIGNGSSAWSALEYFASSEVSGDITVDSVTVDDDEYDAGWFEDLSVPTKNAVYKKIQALTNDWTNMEDLRIIWEGSTEDEYETSLGVEDPTKDITISIPDIDAPYFAVTSFSGSSLPTDGYYATWTSTGLLTQTAAAPGGDVYGPAENDDNVIARFDGEDSYTLQGSAVTINDDGDITTAGDITAGIIQAAQLVITGTGDSYWSTDNVDNILIADYSADTLTLGGATNNMVFDGGGNVDFAGTMTHIGGWLSSKSVIIEALAAADDDFPLGTTSYARTITSVGCRCIGTCTSAATITLQDAGGNGMTITGTNPTCATTGAVTYAAVTAGNALTAGEGFAFDVTNTPNPETDTYEILWTETRD